MPEIPASELRKLRRDAAYGEQARKREAKLAKIRRENRAGGLRQRSEVEGIGAEAERLFREQAAAAGWDASKRGWPDFILRRGSEIAFVEVKAYSAKVKPEQIEVAQLLAAAGFKVFRWSPEGGFVRIYAASETGRPPGGGNGAKPATRGAEDSRRPTPIPDGDLQQLGTASGKPRVSQGTGTPEGTGPEIDYGPPEWRPQEGRHVPSWVMRGALHR